LAETAFALVDGYESTGDGRLLTAARAAADHALARMASADTPALLDHPPDPAAIGLLARPRRPLAPNVRLARALIRLGHLGLGGDYLEKARAILGSFCGDLSGFRTHGIEAALAVEEAIAEPLRIVVRGQLGEEPARRLRAAALRSPRPWTLVESVETAAPAVAEVRLGHELRSAGTAQELTQAIRELGAAERAR
jgi:uncharacterized protein YyaL (SSP411 family)